MSCPPVDPKSHERARAQVCSSRDEPRLSLHTPPLWGSVITLSPSGPPLDSLTSFCVRRKSFRPYRYCVITTRMEQREHHKQQWRHGYFDYFQWPPHRPLPLPRAAPPAQRTATHRNAPQRTPTHPNAPQRTPTHPNAPQRTATHRNAPHRTGARPSTQPHTPGARGHPPAQHPPAQHPPAQHPPAQHPPAQHPPAQHPPAQHPPAQHPPAHPAAPMQPPEAHTPPLGPGDHPPARPR